MSILKDIGNTRITLATEQMNKYDWVIAVMYITVCITFAWLHTEVAIWVYLFVTLRSMTKRFDHKSIGKPLARANDE